MVPTSAAWLFYPTPKDSLRESPKFFKATASRSPRSLFGQSQTYFKNQKTRSRKRLPEELCTKSNVKIVIVFTSVRTSCALKTRVKEHAKAIATLDDNSLLAKHHMPHSHQIDLASVEIVDRSFIHSFHCPSCLCGT